MFGNIKPTKKRCGEQICREYKKYYCGLCFSMSKNFGDLSRIFINYDITNNYLLTASCYNNFKENTARCPWSWRRKKVTYYDYPEISDYFASLNYLLVYYKMIDNIVDDNSKTAKIISKKMSAKIKDIESDLHIEKMYLNNYLDNLHALEKKNELLPIFTVAEGFGILLKGMINPKIFASIDRDVYAEINYWVGIYIYVIDAILDCVSDYSKKRYNPITAGLNIGPISAIQMRKDEILEILKKCKKNTLDLLELYPNIRNEELLKTLFDLKLPKSVCMYLEVDKDEIDT